MLSLAILEGDAEVRNEQAPIMRGSGAASAGDETSRPGDPGAILLHHLLQQQTSLAVINLSVAVVFAFVALHYAPSSVVLAWLAYVGLAQAARFGVAMGGRRTTAATLDQRVVAQRLTIVGFLAGSSWGSMAWLFYGTEPLVLDKVVAFVVAGMAAGSVTALPAHLPTFAAFVISALAPSALRLAVDPRPHSDAMTLLTVGFALGILLLGRYAHGVQRQNAGLYLTNESLVVSLRDAGQQLESRVAERTAQLEEANQQLESANAQMAAEIRRRRRSEAQVRHLVHHDPLTDLPNRLILADRLETAIRRAKRQRDMVAIVVLDVDRFKVINDTHGHLTADQVLRALAARLQAALRGSDTLARMGGDEFAAVLPDLEKHADVEVLARKLIDSVAAPLVIGGRRIGVSISFGIALYPEHGATAAALLSGADLALYDAKQRGRGRYSLLSGGMLHHSRARRQLEAELVGAVTRGEFRVVYQPQISLRHNHVVGAEALVRWAHPAHGLLQPADFIPAAEATGVVREIDRWVIATACRDALAWQRSGKPVRLAVNLSPLEFRHSGLAGEIAGHLAAAGLEPRLLEVEITESAYLDRETTSIEAQLQAIKDLGVTIAIDDFGTGYASLSYLRWLPVDVIKIDRSFISSIGQSRQDEAIVASTVALAATLGKRVIAEGVESTAQLDILRRLGCDEVQGFLLGRPASVDHLQSRLAA
jgi:diguanylate cyclase (GGDEF)-like protein